MAAGIISGFDFVRIPERCKAALFDMDGTLLDSMRYMRLGSIEYLLNHQLPVPENVLPGVFHRTTMKTLEMTAEALGISLDKAAARAEIYERMSCHYRRDIKPKPFAVEFVKALTERGIRCCVATGTPRSVALAALEHCGLSRYMEFITDEEEIGHSKKDGAFFLRVASRINCGASECALFEDSLYAINAAKSVGMWTCAIADEASALDCETILTVSDAYIHEYKV